MSWLKVSVLIVLLSLASAGILALYSRTPPEVRHDVPDEAATDPALGASFTPEQVARHRAFRQPGYLAFFLTWLLPLVALLLLARGPFRELVERVTSLRGGWVVHAIVLAVIVTVGLAVVLFPSGVVRGFANQRAWGLSTQSFGGWLADQARGLLVGAAIAAVSAVAFFGVVRWAPRTWWLWGWGSFTVLTVALTFLFPIVIAPLFNRFTPLEDRALVDRVRAYGAEVGVDIDEVLVADASRRTTAENAYVAGIGSTHRMVLYDTLLAADADPAFVVAHELGHTAERHVHKGLVVSALGLALGFAALFWLGKLDRLWAWAGASGVGDLRALPLLLVFLAVATLVLTPVENAVSRRFERRADEVAIELTDDPAAAIRTFRRLAFRNLADLDPPGALVWALYTHPPIPERLESFVAARDRTSP